VKARASLFVLIGTAQTKVKPNPWIDAVRAALVALACAAQGNDFELKTLSVSSPPDFVSAAR
jgi:hypothetical protein